MPTSRAAILVEPNRPWSSMRRGSRKQPGIEARAIKPSEVPQDQVGSVVFLCSWDSEFMTDPWW